MAKKKNVYKQKQTNKQSVNVNIKINNPVRRKRQKALQQQSQKLQSLNQQRERLFINNVVSIPEYGKINELNNKISKLESDIATQGLLINTPSVLDKSSKALKIEAEPLRKEEDVIKEEDENMKIKQRAFDLLKKNRTIRSEEVTKGKKPERVESIAEVVSQVKGIPANPNRYSSLSYDDDSSYLRSGLMNKPREPLEGIAGEAIPMAEAQEWNAQKLTEKRYKQLKQNNLLPAGIGEYGTFKKDSDKIQELLTIYNKNFYDFTSNKKKKGKK